MMRFSFILYLFIGIFSVAQAQQSVISGRVLDDQTEQPIPGVTVSARGVNQVVQTNNEGFYEFTFADVADRVLEFRYIGYAAQTFDVNSSRTLNVRLVKEDNALDEVVVVGYGTVRKKDLTSSLSTIGGKEIERMPVSNIAEAITGRMPGVQVTSTEGAPGADIIIRVRGGGSVTQDNTPLYVVDGFPVDHINNIAPTDIESFSVLKDASATAIYGSRGANGVVLITTKQAKEGRTSVSYNGYMQQRKLPKKLEVMSPYEFVLAQYEYARTRGQSDVDNFSRYFGVYDDLELYKNQIGTDWQEELFGSGGATQQHNISITGGTDRTKISFSSTYNKDQGIMPGSSYQRLYNNFKLNHKLYDNLRLDLNMRYTEDETMGAGTSGGSNVRVGHGITSRPVNGLAEYIELDPNDLDENDDMYEAFITSLIGPRKMIDQDYRKRMDRNIIMNTALNWNIFDALTYRTELSAEFRNRENKRYYGPLTGESRNVGENKPIGVLENNKMNKFRFANTLTYQMPDINRHSLNVMVGQEILSGRFSTVNNRAKLFDEDITPERLFANMGLGTVESLSTTEGPSERLLSFFGRANYGYDDRYLLSASFRADGSSKFVAPNQWGYFFSSSGAWRISNESFMDDVSFVDDLKLRVGYGGAGNNRIPDDAARRVFSITNNRGIGFGEALQPYWVPGSRLPNPNLRWETTITRTAALEFTLFKHALSGTVEWYQNTAKDLLIEGVVPSYLGYTRQQRNIGQTTNKGIEVSLNAPVLTSGRFKLDAFFNISFNKGVVDKLDGVDQQSFQSNWAGTDLRYQDDYLVTVGREIGLMYGFVTDGFYTSADFEGYDEKSRRYILKEGVPDASTVLGAPVRPGSLKLKNFEDVDGKAEITEIDRQIIGRAQPKHFGGIGFNASYANFDFSVLANWTFGSQVYNTGRISHNMFYRTSYGNMLSTMNYDDRYKYIDASGALVTDMGELDELNKNAKIWSPFSMGNAAPVFHSWAVEDGSFLRISNITLGYSLPSSLINPVKISNCRFFVTVYNAFLFTNYSGYDPEVTATRSNSYNQLTPNVDYSAYPKSRTFTAGVNLTF